MESDILWTHRPSRTQPSTRDVPDHDSQIRRLQSTRLHTPGGAPNGRAIVVEIKRVWTNRTKRGAGAIRKSAKTISSLLWRRQCPTAVYSVKEERIRRGAAADGVNLNSRSVGRDRIDQSAEWKQGRKRKCQWVINSAICGVGVADGGVELLEPNGPPN